MNRVIVYPYEGIQDVDILNTNKNAMIALGYAMQAFVGTGTVFDGLQCLPTSPASLTVDVANGSVMSLQAIDATAYGSLAADTADQIVKQGISIGTTPFTLTPPATSGQSVVYIIQAQYQDVDGGSTTEPFINSSTGAPYSSTVTTVRQGKCVLSLKQGVIAATGSQAVPAPDAGYTALWAITVANGQTTITSGNIAQVGSPFVGTKLTGKLNAYSNLSDVASAAAALANLGGAPLSAFAGSLTSNGYQPLPSGWIVQWGFVGSVGAGSYVNVTLPESYPTGQFLALTSPAVDSNSTVNASTGWSFAGVSSQSQLVVRNLGSTSYNISYISLGR